MTEKKHISLKTSQQSSAGSPRHILLEQEIGPDSTPAELDRYDALVELADYLKCTETADGIPLTLREDIGPELLRAFRDAEAKDPDDWTAADLRVIKASVEPAPFRIIGAIEIEAHLHHMKMAGMLEPGKLDARGLERVQLFRDTVRKDKIKRLTGDVEAKIDVDSLELIHGVERVHDGYISFCRKLTGGKFENLAGVKASELRQWLPDLMPWLLRDAYFSVNASYRAAPWLNTKTGFPDAYRAEDQLRYLHTCYADLDCYKAEMTTPQAVERILQAQDDDVIPPPSIIARSGRGVYLFWLLRDERTGVHQRAWETDIALYKQVNRAALSRLAEYEPRLCPDTAAVDAARVMRVPGSINSKSELPTTFLVQADHTMRVPVYMLERLAEFYGIPVMPRLPEAKRKGGLLKPVENPGSAPNRRAGYISVGEYQLRDLLAIAQHQGGIAQGKRWKFLGDLVWLAKRAGYALSDIEALAGELAATCRPPYPSDVDDTPVKDIVAGIWDSRKNRRYRGDLLAANYGVTPELAEELGLRSIIPEEVRTERQARPSPRAQARAERRKAIVDILSNRGDIPSLRTLTSLLKARGIPCSPETVRGDLKAVWPEEKGV